MKIKKFLAVFVAAAMCFSLSLSAFAVNGEEESTQENVTVENTTVEESTSEIVSEEATSEENTSEEVTSEENNSEEASTEENVTEEIPEEESTEKPDEGDVIDLIINLLGKIELDEVKDALNDINEALGLPRVETFTDIPAYADALYEKLEEMGLGYADIINGLASSDLLEWLNNLLFGGGSSSPSTTAPSDSELDGELDGEQNGEESIIPDTGIAFGAVGAAIAVMGGSGAVALFLRKRNGDKE